jgi:hypothetical protein
MDSLIKDKLRVGLLLNSEVLPAWIEFLIKQIQSCDMAQIALVVINGSVSTPGTLDWLTTAFLAVDRKFFPPQPDPNHLVNCHSFLLAYPQITTNPGVSAGDELDAATLVAMQKANLDVVLRFGFQPLRSWATAAAKTGIWSLRFGTSMQDNAENCGCKEVLHHEPVTVSTLVMEGEQGRVQVLRQSFSATDLFSPAQTRRKVLWKSISFFKRELAKLYQLGSNEYLRQISEQPVETSEKPVVKPGSEINLIDTSGKIPSVAIRYLHNKAQKAVSNTHWQLFYRFGDGFSNKVSDYTAIQAPRNAFWSDPFVVFRDGHHFLFFEELVYRQKKGRICVVEIDSQGQTSEAKVILEKDYHLSYPFIFEYQGALFMIPETSANHNIEVYRCSRFPDEWKFEKNLFTGISAVDTTLHHDGQKWWLFCNIRETEGASSWDELFLFYADNPLSDQWTPHLMNPIVSDVCSARPAGKIFMLDGKLVRPAQDSSRGYGWRVVLNQISRLDEEVYQETPLNFLEPVPGSGLKGIHTFNQQNGLSVIDGKGRVWR